MKSFLSFPLVALLLVFAVQLKAQNAEPNYADWPTGAIYAINLQERKLALKDEVFRVALKVSISDTENNKMAFSELEPQYYVAYRLEPATGDIIDIVTLAKP